MNRAGAYTVGVFASLFDDCGRILCVRQNYARRLWTTPGGRLEPGETPQDGLRREVLEETGIDADVGDLIGTYLKVYANDLILSFRVSLKSQNLWTPNSEIADMRFFEPRDLPAEMAYNTRVRILDALNDAHGVLRVFAAEDKLVDHTDVQDAPT